MVPRDDSGSASTSPSPPSEGAETRYFRSGLGLRREVRGEVEAEYDSAVVRALRDGDFVLQQDGITFRLARQFGFCYGVERAVDYAYETVRRFPDRRIVLIGEIIHNPKVNARLRSLGIRFLGDPGVEDASSLGPDDVVVLPAFGVPVELFDLLRDTGAILVDTTCGSVLNVWKNVERYAREDRTAIVHGKASHEETRATVSRVHLTEDAHYVVVLDLEEARLVADTIRGAATGLDRDTFLARFEGRTSKGFDPERHLGRIGMANQTTMLSAESLAIARVVEEGMQARWGPDEAAERFRSFDTICSATQDRQDALRALIAEPLDLLLVVGGYNSSNTGHLLELAEGTVRAYHVEGPESLVSPTTIRHKPVGTLEETESVVEGGWLPRGTTQIGLTAGASTPDAVIGAVVNRVLQLRAEHAAAT